MFTTIQYEKHLREGSSRKDDITTVDRAHGVITRKRAGKPDKIVHTTEPVFDPISLIYQFRRLDLRPGSWLIPYVAFDHNSGSGTGVTNFVTDSPSSGRE